MEPKDLPADLKKLAGSIFTDPTTMATPAVVLCIQLFDEDCLDWDPVFLEEAIRKYVGVDVDDDVMQRIQALSVVLNSSDFFKLPETFHIVTASLLDPDSTPEQMSSAPSPVEMAWSCAEVKALLGEEYSNAMFSPQVQRYCGVALMYAGLYKAPAALSFADFPKDRYPDLAAQEDLLMKSFEKDQQTTLDDIESSIEILKKLYRQQLASLAVFGGNPEAFKKLSD